MAFLDISRSGVQGQATARSLRTPALSVLAAAALIAAAALLPVVQSSTTTTTGYEIRRLETRKADLRAAIFNAQSEIAQLGSLERIEQEARGRLGMVPAERTIIVQVQEPAPPARLVPVRFLPQPAPTQPVPSRGGLHALLSRLALR